MKKIIAVFITILLSSTNAQNIPVSLHGQYSLEVDNTYSLPTLKIECKRLAARIAIKAYLMIMNPEMMEVEEDVISCIYDELLNVEVVEQTIENNILLTRVIASTYSNLMNPCLP
jgi:hypothetical protein